MLIHSLHKPAPLICWCTIAFVSTFRTAFGRTPGSLYLVEATAYDVVDGHPE